MIGTPNFPIATKLRYHDVGNGHFVIAIGMLGLAAIDVEGDRFSWSCLGLDGGSDKISKIADVIRQINDHLMMITADGSAEILNMMMNEGKVH